MILYACLVATNNGKLLLVRELGEELNIHVRKDSLRYLYTVVGPAYGVSGEVSLVCFAAEWDGSIGPAGEISEVAWMSYEDTDKVAPAIHILIQEHLA